LIVVKLPGAFDTDGGTDFSICGGGEVAWFCTVLFAGVVRGAEDGGETELVMAGDDDGDTARVGWGAGGGICIFRQGCRISILGPGTSEQRENEVTMPNIGRPPKWWLVWASSK
jgi:hypothetical protein